MKLSSSLAVVGGAMFALGHGGVMWYQIGSNWFKGYAPYTAAQSQTPSIQRAWDTFDPILDPTLNILECNTAGTPGQLTTTIKAGTPITAYWNNPWAHNAGPLIVWMAACPGDCTSTTPTGKSWFKIDQSGLISGNMSLGFWGQGKMIQQNSSWTSTVPSNLKPGNYLIRHELIAVHTSNQPQFYPECGQLVVTGSGTQTPSSNYLASIPGVWSMSDPAININIYASWNAGSSNYTIPGPAVWKGN